MAHIRSGHTADLLLADVFCALQWFNPVAWWLKRELKAVHEYEADALVARECGDARHYQLLLIKKAAGTRLYSMANSFNHSKIQKRITMMLKEKSNPWARLKCLYVLPLAVVGMTAFALPEISSGLHEISSVKVKDLLSDADRHADNNSEKCLISFESDSLKPDSVLLEQLKGLFTAEKDSLSVAEKLAMRLVEALGGMIGDVKISTLMRDSVGTVCSFDTTVVNSNGSRKVSYSRTVRNASVNGSSSGVSKMANDSLLKKVLMSMRSMCLKQDTLCDTTISAPGVTIKTWCTMKTGKPSQCGKESLVGKTGLLKKELLSQLLDSASLSIIDQKLSVARTNKLGMNVSSMYQAVKSLLKDEEVELYVNGKKTDKEDFLKQNIPADNIKSIDMQTNDSGKQIIRLKTKK